MISTYLRSACCGARVQQVYQAAADVFPIYCLVCGNVLGTPGQEDVPDSELRGRWARKVVLSPNAF